MLLHKMINILKLIFEIFMLYMYILKNSHATLPGEQGEPPISAVYCNWWAVKESVMWQVPQPNYGTLQCPRLVTKK